MNWYWKIRKNKKRAVLMEYSGSDIKNTMEMLYNWREIKVSASVDLVSKCSA